MIGSIIYLALTGMVLAIPEPAREPWATTDVYFKVVERDFRLDSMLTTFILLKNVRLIFVQID